MTADGSINIGWLAVCSLWLVAVAPGTRLAAQAAPAAPSPRVAGTRTASQDAEEFESLDLRVLSVRRVGLVEVDRGSRDLVRLGDRVVFRPLGRAPVSGRVKAVQDRTALVELDELSIAIEPGMPGVVLIPGGRFEQAVDVPIVPQGPRPPHAPWQNRDEDFEEGMPLLSNVDVLEPWQRPVATRGRLYFLANVGRSSLDNRTDSLIRLGADVEMENPFGRGGRILVGGELNNRSVYIQGQEDRAFSKGRLDRASYAWGGTRWEPVRQEVGRFLQHGMPEFGLLDGWEWTRRNESGSQFGGSIGYMPEPDVNLTTGNDFQVSGFYRWVSDDSERFSASAGVQKTWHNGHSDRDLLVAKVHLLPENGWQMNASAWVDYYGSNDDVKDNGLELTEAHASAIREYEGVGGLTIAFDHRRFPELLRDEYSPVLAAELEDERNDRLSARGWRWLEDDLRLFGEVGAWDDDDESGGDVEVGVEVDDLLARGSWSSASLWFTDGEFSRSKGARFSYGRPIEGSGGVGQWDVSYQISQHDNKGFDEDFADVLQHWLRFSWVFQLPQGWLGTLSADARLWDDNEEDAESLSLYLSKNF